MSLLFFNQAKQIICTYTNLLYHKNNNNVMPAIQTGKIFIHLILITFLFDKEKYAARMCFLYLTKSAARLSSLFINCNSNKKSSISGKIRKSC
ncbi:MAG TPA: hypothetical protein DD733_03610 [Clostridiales bacterium]|nr:hypothetical protein [Clostridiales bacterium]